MITEGTFTNLRTLAEGHVVATQFPARMAASTHRPECWLICVEGLPPVQVGSEDDARQWLTYLAQLQSSSATVGQ